MLKISSAPEDRLKVWEAVVLEAMEREGHFLEAADREGHRENPPVSGNAPGGRNLFAALLRGNETRWGIALARPRRPPAGGGLWTGREEWVGTQESGLVAWNGCRPWKRAASRRVKIWI